MTKALLTENEAVIFLGVSVALLFKYCSHAPKYSVSKKLKFVKRGDRRGFRTEDLDEWDKFLWEPWPCLLYTSDAADE